MNNNNIMSDWVGPIVSTDISSICRSAHHIPDDTPVRPCFRIDNVLSKSECEQILESVKVLHESEPVSLEPGVRSQVTIEDEYLQKLVWERIKHVLPQELDGGQVVGLQSKWRHGMYHPGQSVFAHMDFRHSDKSIDFVCSRISVTIYLNDSFTGGETAFVKQPIGYDGSHGGIFFRSVPITGSAIIFYQCVPEYFHTAEVVTGGVKCIMRSDVMYNFPSKLMANVSGEI